MLRRSFMVILCIIVMFMLLYMSYNMKTRQSNQTNIIRKQTKEKQLSYVKQISGKFSSYFDLTPKKLKDKKGSITHYVQDEYMFGNIKKVEDIVEEARKEIEAKLNGRAKNPTTTLSATTTTTTTITTTTSTTTTTTTSNSSALLDSTQSLKTNTITTKHPKVSSSSIENYIPKMENEGTLTEDIIENITINSLIRTDYKFKKPSEDDLRKLTSENLKLLEEATDPLSISATCDKKQFLLVLIMSHPDSRERRDSIRNTWGYSYNDDIDMLKNVKAFRGEKFDRENMFRIVFVMGDTVDDETMKSVHEESENYKDIVFGNFQENYKNLTLKTRLALKWAYYDCQSVYVVKTDDDVFINPVPLTEWLKDKPRTNFYTGYCNSNSPVIRNKQNKWYVSYEDYPKETYPTYCLGGGYLFSSDVLGAFLKASYGRKYFPMEDLYIGIIINEMESVKPRDERRHFDLIYGGQKNGCEMNNLFLAHRVLGKQLKTHLDRSRLALKTCSRENSK